MNSVIEQAWDLFVQKLKLPEKIDFGQKHAKMKRMWLTVLNEELAIKSVIQIKDATENA